MSAPLIDIHIEFDDDTAATGVIGVRMSGYETSRRFDRQHVATAVAEALRDLVTGIEAHVDQLEAARRDDP